MFFLHASAQNKRDVAKECEQAMEIVLNDSLIVPKKSDQYLLWDSNSNYVLFYPDENSRSFWYKLTIQTDGEFVINLASGDSSVYYYFFIYKHTGIGNLCEDVFRKKYIPVRANAPPSETKDKKKKLGEKDSTKVKFDLQHRTSPNQPVQAKAGETYYINVYRLVGEDCGHYLTLKRRAVSSGFHTTFKSCYNDPVQKIANPLYVQPVKPVTAKIENDISPRIRKQVVNVNLSGIVYDSLTGRKLQGEIKWWDEANEREVVVKTSTEGSYTTTVDAKVIYKLTCNAAGYREKTQKFIRQNLASEAMQQDFYLSPLRAGDNFILKNIHFHAGTYAFKTESMPALEQLSAFMKAYPDTRIEIRGHTNGKGRVKKKRGGSNKKEEGWDFRGNEKKLSKFRAEAVKKYLIRHGISQTHIITSGFGGTQMLFPEPKSRVEHDMNKRVEIFILPSETGLMSVAK